MTAQEVNEYFNHLVEQVNERVHRKVTLPYVFAEGIEVKWDEIAANFDVLLEAALKQLPKKLSYDFRYPVIGEPK